MSIELDKLPKIVADMVHVLSMRSPQTPQESILASVNYSLGKIASNLRVTMDEGDGVPIVVNVFYFTFISSGKGKNSILNFIDNYYLDGFKEGIEEAFKKMLAKAKEKRMMELVDNDTDEDEAQEIIDLEFGSLTGFIFEISDGTIEGFKNLRETCETAQVGASSINIDELAMNLGRSGELLTMALETFDTGNHSAKITKGNKNSRRVKSVPTNMMCYASPSRIFDGGKIEDELMSLYETGLARRSLYCYPSEYPKQPSSYDERKAIKDESFKLLEEAHKTVGKHFTSLSKRENFKKNIILSEDCKRVIGEYNIKCEILSDEMEVGAISAELEQRGWKASKLAAIYAFIDGSSIATKEHGEQAVYVTELSGKSFDRIINQPQIHERMFNFMKLRKETTILDLEERPWFRGTVKNKSDLFMLCRAYAFRNNYLFRVKELESVEFYSFVEVPKTDVKNITISISKDITKGFKKKVVPFEILHEVVCNSSFNYSAGTFKRGHRKKDNYEEKQNLVIIDVDSGMKLETAKLMFSNYKCLIATTKSHQKEKNGLTCDRYRIIFVTDRTIKLDSEMYARFMTNVYNSLGVPADISCSDSSRFYYGSKGEYYYSKGTKLFEISDLIPDTSKEIERKVSFSKSGICSTNGVERFLLGEAAVGNRSNNMIKYAMFVKDGGYSFEDAKEKVLDFNSKLPEPLTIKEINQTIIKTLKGKYNE